VVGIGRPRANGGDEGTVGPEDVAVPFAGPEFEERHHLPLVLPRRLEHGEGVQAHQFAAVVGIAVAGAGATVGDIAHDRAGIAADLAFHTRFNGLSDHLNPLARRGSPPVPGRVWPEAVSPAPPSRGGWPTGSPARSGSTHARPAPWRRKVRGGRRPRRCAR